MKHYVIIFQHWVDCMTQSQSSPFQWMCSLITIHLHPWARHLQLPAKKKPHCVIIYISTVPSPNEQVVQIDGDLWQHGVSKCVRIGKCIIEVL